MFWLSSSLRFIFVLIYRVRLMKAAGEAKAPLVHSEALTWLNRCVKDFGARAFPARQVINFAVSELEHVNPKVRFFGEAIN